MNVDQAFPSRYIKSPDLQGHAIKLKMDRVVWETVQTDRKLVLYFQTDHASFKDRGLVLNKTNANRISFMHGKEMDDWGGKVIELYSEMVDFQGKAVEGIRVRPPSNPPKSAANSGFMDNARQQAKPTGGIPSAAPPIPEPESYGAALDDEIPFAPEWR